MTYAVLGIKYEKFLKAAMTLSELVYQIDGEVKIETVNDQGAAFIATLLDNLREPTIVRFSGENRPPSQEAVGIGGTEREASENLVDLVEGSYLVHSWPVMWTSSEQTLRIPVRFAFRRIFVYPSPD